MILMTFWLMLCIWAWIWTNIHHSRLYSSSSPYSHDKHIHRYFYTILEYHHMSRNTCIYIYTCILLEELRLSNNHPMNNYNHISDLVYRKVGVLKVFLRKIAHRFINHTYRKQLNSMILLLCQQTFLPAIESFQIKAIPRMISSIKMSFIATWN